MWNLVYADIVLVARNKKVLQDMTATFNRFLTKKKNGVKSKYII